MRKVAIFLIFASALAVQPSFANTPADSKSCGVIVKACLNAGFITTEMMGKRFWQDCMRPILSGETVQGITVNSDTVKICRNDKIKELKSALNDFQKIS